jgi:hypothetical protein
MTCRVEVTTRASHDLDNIYQYIQAADSRHAAMWFNGLYAASRFGDSRKFVATSPAIRKQTSQLPHHLRHRRVEEASNYPHLPSPCTWAGGPFMK